MGSEYESSDGEKEEQVAENDVKAREDAEFESYVEKSSE